MNKKYTRTAAVVMNSFFPFHSCFHSFTLKPVTSLHKVMDDHATVVVVNNFCSAYFFVGFTLTLHTTGFACLAKYKYYKM